MRVVIQVLKAVSMDPELNKLNFINLIYIMVKITIQPSTRKNKKFHAILDTGETIKNIHFGDSRYEDYTIHKDKQRKENYIKRHANTPIYDLLSPAFYSRWFLWNKPTLKKSKDDILKRFKEIDKIIINV